MLPVQTMRWAACALAALLLGAGLALGGLAPSAGAAPGPVPPPVDDGGLTAPTDGTHGEFATAVRWPSQTLTYSFVAGHTHPTELSESATEAAFAQAFAIWAAASPFTFTPVADCAGPVSCAVPEIRIRFDAPFTECDALYLGCAYYPPFGDPSDSPISGDIFINDEYDWSDQPFTGASPYDLVNVAVHEIGHAIGMRHTDPGGLCAGAVDDPVMCAVINRVARTLHADDHAGITSLYGPAPANDDFAGAELLTGTSGAMAGSMSAATFEPDEPCANEPVGATPEDACSRLTTWYSFTSPADGRFAIRPTTLGLGPVDVVVYTGGSLAALQPVTSRLLMDPTSRLAFLAETGVTYAIQVQGLLGEGGSYDLAWTHQPGVLQRFGDVALDHLFFDEIEGAAARGVLAGYGDSTFRPSAPVTRQALAAFLYRQYGAPPTGCQQQFSDVGPSHPFFTEICWLQQQGITQGYAGGTFRPGASVTRMAVARMLRKAEGAAVGTGCFEPWDVPTDSPFFGDVCWMFQQGITTAVEFRPNSPLSRQAMAAFLERASNLP